jgi:hypothetical protein
MHLAHTARLTFFNANQFDPGAAPAPDIFFAAAFIFAILNIS